MNCNYCNCDVEKERELLDLSICLACAKRTNPPKVCGYMHYLHKTAPVLALTTPEAFANFKQDTYRRGQSSILRNKMVASGRLI